MFGKDSDMIEDFPRLGIPRILQVSPEGGWILGIFEECESTFRTSGIFLECANIQRKSENVSEMIRDLCGLCPNLSGFVPDFVQTCPHSFQTASKPVPGILWLVPNNYQFVDIVFTKLHLSKIFILKIIFC